MNVKYELTDEHLVHGSTILYRIRALKDFSDVKAGQLGGFVQSAENLSYDDDAWIYDDAWVCDRARVSGRARVCDRAWIYGDARVSGDARIFGNARVYSNARISGDARISSSGQFFVAVNVGTERGTLSVFPGSDGKILASRGCFIGTVEEFLLASSHRHNDVIHKEYRLLIEVALSRITPYLKSHNETQATSSTNP